MELTEAITRRAGGLAGERALRGADAVHLASALVFGRAQVLVTVWDLRLRAGARAAGLPVAPAGDP